MVTGPKYPVTALTTVAAAVVILTAWDTVGGTADEDLGAGGHIHMAQPGEGTRSGFSVGSGTWS